MKQIKVMYILMVMQLVFMLHYNLLKDISRCLMICLAEFILYLHWQSYCGFEGQLCVGGRVRPQSGVQHLFRKD